MSHSSNLSPNIAVCLVDSCNASNHSASRFFCGAQCLETSGGILWKCVITYRFFMVKWSCQSCEEKCVRDTATGRRLGSRIPRDCSHNWENIWLCPALADGGLRRDPGGEIYIHCPGAPTPHRDNGLGKGQGTSVEKKLSLSKQTTGKLFLAQKLRKVTCLVLFGRNTNTGSFRTISRGNGEFVNVLLATENRWNRHLVCTQQTIRTIEAM